jgi:gliding motility-associated-like protein
MKFTFKPGGVFLLPFLIISVNLWGQSFSFNCTRDTLVPGCPANFCFTLKGTIPDVRQQTNTYTINPSGSVPGCFPTYVAPNDPQGTPTSLTVDDTYSSLITMGFPFSFYGSLYTTLAASTNGYLTFDASKASGYAAWSITADLPSANYDRAVIMGPNHDLFPTTTQPNQRIQYQVYGTAPHRRWVLSFNQVRLFSCTSLTENTHQIVLYESLNIIEVLVYSKQTCATWNSGRAIIGIQDWDRTNGMMAPGRTAMGPTWGALNMNESWRFVPNSGNSLLKRVELVDNAGAIVSTLTPAQTTNLGNGKLEVAFPNICPPAGATTQYIIRSVYEKFDDPSVEIVGSDTVRVNRSAGLAATATPNAASCGNNNGSITVATPSGGTPPYQYSIDGGTTWQSSNVFNGLAVGSYTVKVKDNPAACTIDIPVNVVSAGNLATTVASVATACTAVNNGSITISSAAGAGPHTFSLDGGTPIQGTLPYTFTNVPAGNHTVVVTDVPTSCNSGSVNVNVAVGPGVSATTTTAATSCPTAANGTITVDATAGVGPFTYQIDGGTIQTGANPFVFSGLSAGTHNIVVRDNLGCQLTRQVTVPSGPSLTATLSQTATTCSGAINGSLTVTPSSGTAPFEFSLDGGAFVTGTVPYTFNGLSSGNHSVVVKDALGCTSNATASIIVAGPPVTSTATSTAALCNGGNTGTLTVLQPSVGTAPFEYSLDGTNWQTNNVFNGLTAGTYTVRFREAAGCVGSTSVNVTEPTALTLTATTVPVICNAQTNGLITATAGGGIAPYQFSVDGGTTWQPANSFNVQAGNYTVTLKDANSCTTTTTVTVTEPAVLTATALTTNATCNGGNDGTITVTANGGNGSFDYSIDNGVNWQTNSSFNLAPGNYTVLVKDALNCTVSVNAVVGLTNDLTYTPQTDVTICESKSTQLNLVSNGLQYDWTPATGLSAVNIPNPVASPTVTTQYIVNVTLGRCSAKDTVMVNVNAAPVPNAGPDIFICYGQSATLQGSGGTVYKWTPSTFLNNTSSPNAVSTPDTDITYVLSILSDANGCAGLVTDSVHIDVTPPLQVLTYPADTIGYPGDQFQLLAVPSDPDATNFIWTPSVGLSNAQIANPVVTIGSIGTDVLYKVVASTVAGCKGEAFVNVRVYKGPDIYVPTGFTPNGDGKNDKFTPFPVGMKSYNYFRVFNRWGQVVYQTKKLNDGWDGTIGGQLQPDGIYVWMIEGLTKDDRIITKKGTVMLIK